MTHQCESMDITRLLAALLVASIAHVPARADTLGPIDSTGMPKQWPDGPLKDFLERLQRPDANLYPYFEGNPISCCGAGDVVDTKFRVEHGKGSHPEDTWYAWLKGKWVRIPPEKIVPDYAPGGQAFLFVQVFYSPTDGDFDEQIVCFVRPNGGL